jgi:hypothetical protein
MRRLLAGNMYYNSLTHLEYMASMEHVTDMRQQQTGRQTKKINGNAAFLPQTVCGFLFFSLAME